MMRSLSIAHAPADLPGRISTGGFQGFNRSVGLENRKTATTVPTLPTLPTLFSTPSPEVGGGEGGNARMRWNRRSGVAGGVRMTGYVLYKGPPRGGCHASRSIIYPPEATPPKPAHTAGVLHVSPAPPHISRSQRWHGNPPGGPPYRENGGVSA
jgi:hypothetical protein